MRLTASVGALFGAVAVACAGTPVACDAATLLRQVRAAGELSCGIDRADSDYSKDDPHGNLAALGADVCKAVAVAVLGPGARVELRGFPDEPHALRALHAGAVALVAAASPSASNAAAYSLGFGPPIFHDAQGFLVSNAAGITQLRDFAGRQICYIANTPADTTLNAVFQARRIAFLPFPFEEQGEMEAALFTGHCAAITADVSRLADTHFGFRGGSARFRLLGEFISDDPLAPAYRKGDSQWSRIVDATIRAVIRAEEDGITAANAATMRRNPDPAIRRFLGAAPGMGRSLGLDDDWAMHVIQAVGNYGEIYERDVGAGSPLGIERGGNAPPHAGGPAGGAQPR